MWAGGAREHPDHLVADLLGVGVEVPQDADSNARALTRVAAGLRASADGDALVPVYEPEQDVLGADVVMVEVQRFSEREFQDPFGAWCERDLTGSSLFASADDPHHTRADALDG